MTRVPSSSNAIGVLKRREIEARLLAPLIEALGREFSREKVLQIVRETIVGIAGDQGRQLVQIRPMVREHSRRKRSNPFIIASVLCLIWMPMYPDSQGKKITKQSLPASRKDTRYRIAAAGDSPYRMVV